MLSEIKLRLNLAPCGASDTKKGLFETTDNFSISAVELLQRPDQAEHAPPPSSRPPPRSATMPGGQPTFYYSNHTSHTDHMLTHSQKPA